MITFGPVPSRRLGRSLGINNIPAKTCTYSCVYCQVGRTTKMQVQRSAFRDPVDIISQVRARVEAAGLAGEPIDYLTFVPDGEPVLDLNLGREIELLKTLGIKIAVISNASLLGRQAIRQELLQADWVSLKMDTVQESNWRRVDRPHPSLQLDAILKGALQFADQYRGILATETMLVRGLNDDPSQIRALADYLRRLQPATAYLSVPTRPPAEPWVQAPDEESINRAFQILAQVMQHVELLTGYEGDQFVATGNLAADLLSITAVHPMRHDAVVALLSRAGADWAVVHELIGDGLLIATEFEGHTFYLRRLGERLAPTV